MNTSAIDTNGAANSLNGAVTSLNGAATSLNGAATSVNGAATSVNGAATSVSGPATDSDTQNTVNRIVIGIEYNGAQFHGWQRQKSPVVATVQAALESALAKVANHSVSLICAGRTDAGVHALCQVAHFETSAVRKLKAWVQGVNSHLPASVRVISAQQVEPSFHARFSATARRYRYWIHNLPTRPGVLTGLISHVPQQLDEQRMHCAAQCLLGENDFTTFRAQACQSNTPMRNVHSVSVTRHQERICIEIQANAFLLHMVRNIAGSLIEVGIGKQTPEWIAEIFRARDRGLAAATARPDGLYLVAVSYPEITPSPTASSSLF